MIKGVIFDFDGTIVDSEISRFDSLNEVLKMFDYVITKEAWNLNYRRINSIAIFDDIKKRKEFDFDSNEMYLKSYEIRKKLEKKGVRILPGFIDFYNFLKKNNISMMIASGGKREHIESVMKIDNLPKIKYLGREDYDKTKPEPDSYLKALELMRLDSNDVIIFDDSVSGLKAGISAGCRVIAINCQDLGVSSINFFKKIDDFRDINFDNFLNY